MHLYMCLFPGGAYLYLAGGEYPDGNASRSVWRYDPCLDTWDEMQSMQTARSELGRKLCCFLMLLYPLMEYEMLHM